MIKINLNPTNRELSQFGVFALFGFPLIGWLIHAKLGAPDWLFYGLIGLGVITLVLSRVSARLVKPIFIGLMIVATPIGFVISMALMLLIFYGLFLPVGLIFRLLGRDPLDKRPDPTMSSYWHVRGAPRPLASYLRLY